MCGVVLSSRGKSPSVANLKHLDPSIHILILNVYLVEGFGCVNKLFG